MEPIENDIEPIEPERSGLSTTAIVLIVCAIVAPMVLACVVIVCIVAITTIGQKANNTFTTVGATLGSGPMTDQAQPDSEVDAVKEVLGEQTDDWNRERLERFMGAYSRTDVVLRADGDTRRGWQAVSDWYRGKYQSKGAEMGWLTHTDVIVRPSGTRADVTGRWQIDVRSGTQRGRFTMVMRKEAGGWKIIDHQRFTDR